ncbi:hypothetical protein CesoFtcFv8_012361 [Champsocephalus esox]|uniref:Apolipoprotein A-II n=1 Tax=Champsocephalus esox TaxID=159716 RepID=A0AAN8BV33_9TELE|nr:hypothetical protein CesoFtcFv8_012361 [Champsocephalus esox]
MIQLLLTRAKGKMHTKELVFGLILLMQACGPLLAKTKAPKQPNSPRILQWLAEEFREVNATVQGYMGPFLGFLFAYYEDHIQPVTDSCFQWASRVCELPVTDNSLSENTVTSWTCTSNPTADMNAKYTLALILALQVSMSLCEVAQPSQELVDKYDGMKTVFYKRLLNAFSKVQAAAAPLMENAETSEHGRIAKEYFDVLKTQPQLQAVVKVATGMAHELSPLVDQARLALLGLYEHHLRPEVGNHLSEAIDSIKVYLDQHMPAV